MVPVKFYPFMRPIYFLSIHQNRGKRMSHSNIKIQIKKRHASQLSPEYFIPNKKLVQLNRLSWNTQNHKLSQVISHDHYFLIIRVLVLQFKTEFVSILYLKESKKVVHKVKVFHLELISNCVLRFIVYQQIKVIDINPCPNENKEKIKCHINEIEKLVG